MNMNNIKFVYLLPQCFPKRERCPVIPGPVHRKIADLKPIYLDWSIQRHIEVLLSIYIGRKDTYFVSLTSHFTAQLQHHFGRPAVTRGNAGYDVEYFHNQRSYVIRSYSLDATKPSPTVNSSENEKRKVL